MQTVCANSNLHYSLFCISSSAFAIICLYCSFTLSGASICTLPFPPPRDTVSFLFDIILWIIYFFQDMRIRSQLLFVKVLLFTPFTVTRFAMHRNHAFAWFRAVILGFSVNFVHKKRLAERYQWTVTSRCHFLITPDTTFLRIRKRDAEAPQLWIADTAW